MEKCINTLSGHTEGIYALKTVTEPNLLISASEDHTVRCWDIRTCKCHITWKGHHQGVTCLEGTGHTLLSGSRDGSVREWTLKSTKQICSFGNQENNSLWSIQFNGLNALFAAGERGFSVWDYNKEKKLWDSYSRANTGNNNVNSSSAIYSVKFMNDFCLVAGRDRTVKIWHV